VSTRQILGAVGAVVGAYFGNPQLGYAIGSAIGGAVDPEVIKGPSIGDVIDQTSLEGGPRPFVYALSKPLAGNIIAQGPPRIVRRRESQGKGGPKVETESVYRTYAIGIGEGEVSFVQVWRNGQLVYDILQDLVTDEDNANFLQHARFFSGSFDQTPSPDLETILGVGTTPAHRGTAYMVMADEDLTDLRGAIPQWTFRVQRCAASQASLLAISNGGNDPTHQVMRSTDGANFEIIETPVNTNAPGEGFLWTGLVHSRALGITIAVCADGHTDGMKSLDAGATWEVLASHVGSQWAAVARSDELGLFVAVRPHATQAIMTSPDGDTWTLRDTPATFINGRAIAFCEASGLFIAGQIAVGSSNIITSPDGITWTARATPINNSVSEIAARGLRVFAVSVANTTLIESSDGGFTWSSRQTGAPFGMADVVFSNLSNDRALGVGTSGIAYCDSFGDFSEVVDLLDTHWSGVCYSETFGGFYATSTAGTGSDPDDIHCVKMPDGFNAVVPIDLPSSCWGQNWAKIIAIDASQAGECSFSVAEVVTDICARASLAASLIDVSELEELTCRGFVVTNTYPAFAALKALSEIFFFDPVDSDGIVKFVRRGGNSVDTITEDEMLDDEQDIEQSRRSDAIQVPRVLHINYHDVAGGIATDKQTNERSGDRRAKGEMSVQSAVLMNANEAAQVVAIHHKVMIEDQRGELKFCLPDSFIGLTPSDNVIVQWQQRSIRARINKSDIHDGYQELVCYYDRQSAYTSNVEGIPAAPQTPPPSSVVGPTLIQPLDIHILRDADDNIGLLYYVAVSGVLQAWQGALVELSLDGGANYIESESTRSSSVMGELITPLGDHPAAFADEVNTVTIRIDTPFADLTQTDLTGMMNGLNLAIIGDELVQFANADEVVEGTWQLSLLLRGRKGTQSAAHVVGERFVLLDPSTLHTIPASLADIGRAITFRATSFGTSAETGTVVTMSYTGRSQSEREPAYLMAHRDGDDAIVSWQGVGRLGSGATVAHGARFAGYRVTFDDGSIEEDVDTDDQELTHDVSAFASPLTIRVSQLNDLTGQGPFIEVILT
jgi:hypothetical protein